MNASADTPVETAAFDVCELQQLIRRRPDIGVVIYHNLAADVSGKLKRTQEPS